MTEELEKREFSIMVPLLVGGIVGAGIALLLAPKAGKDLRQDIKDIASSTRRKVVSVVERGRELYAGSTTAVKTAVEAGKNAFVEETEKHMKAA